MEEKIKIFGARTHNLKDINLEIPKNKLVVVCGLSGSGKTSLAFDTIYIEGQRRYLESLSSYARQFLGGFKKAEVEKIDGLSPTIAINQKTISFNPRSTVGTITEIYDYLRLLFARGACPICPNCNIEIKRQTSIEIAEKILNLAESFENLIILAPVISQKKGFHKGVIEQIERSGWPNVRIDGVIYPIEEAKTINLDKNKKHNIEVIVDRISFEFFYKKISLTEVLSKKEKEVLKRKKKKIKAIISEEKQKILESVKKAIEIGKGIILVEGISKKNKKEFTFSTLFSCSKCGLSLPKVEPNLFSFNSPYGACPVCQGLGKKMEVEKSFLLNPELSLAEGAILPLERISRFGRRALGFSHLKWELEEILEEKGYSFNTPFKKLPKEIQDILLYGDLSFEGVIPRLERVYYETESEFIRREISRYLVEKPCPECCGARLKKEALAFKFGGKDIYEICLLSIKNLIKFFKKTEKTLSSNKRKITFPIIKEILLRAKFLEDVGLSYLNLARDATSLAVGENQRLRLASQLGSSLSGIIYVLDEPTIGLHQRDIFKLINALKKLRDLGNTIIVIEHDERVIRESDWVIEIGPLAGEEGGRVVFQGPREKFEKANTLTSKYLKGKLKAISNFKKEKIGKSTLWLEVIGANQFNLKNLDFKFPLGRFVVVCGVSGSGKSTLVIEVLAKALQRKLTHQKVVPGKYQKIIGENYLDKIILVDQSPIGKTPRSNPATYTGVFTPIREVFARLNESRLRGYSPSHFSFNTSAGRCELCKGEGFKKIEMYFLPDIYVECEMCQGKRYQPEILEIKYKGKNIADVLEMSVKEAISFFEEFSIIKEKLSLLKEVGLGYVKLGQPATTLSGGESQRIKLADELSKRSTGRTLYVLDEPTVGLHFEDVKKLLIVLRKLQEKGNSILVIEHNPDFIKEADWIVELGPEGGEKGGKIIFEGTLEALKKIKTPTSKFLF